MLSSTKFALTIAIFASVASSTFAIHCYHCDSARESTCGDNFKSQENFKVDCDRLQQQQPHQTQQYGPFYIVNATGCVKKLLDNMPGQPRIQRTCFYGDIRNTVNGCQTEPNLPYQRVMSCDVCKQDYCNGSSMLTSTGLGTVLLLMLARLLV